MVRFGGVPMPDETIEDPTLQHNFKGHKGVVHALAFKPNLKQLVSAAEDHSLMIWSPGVPNARAYKFSGHTDAVTAVAYSPDGTTIASGSTIPRDRWLAAGGPAQGWIRTRVASTPRAERKGILSASGQPSGLAARRLIPTRRQGVGLVRQRILGRVAPPARNSEHVQVRNLVRAPCLAASTRGVVLRFYRERRASIAAE